MDRVTAAGGRSCCLSSVRSSATRCEGYRGDKFLSVFGQHTGHAKTHGEFQVNGDKMVRWWARLKHVEGHHSTATVVAASRV